MRHALLCTLLCGGLFGQSTIYMRKPDKAPETLAQLAKKAQKDRSATWILLGGTRSEWTSSFHALVEADEDLATVDLPVQTAASTSAIASELRSLRNWGPEARWVLLGTDGRDLDSGVGPVDPKRLVEALESHGIQGKTREMEAFLAKHPGHLQAQEALLSLYLISGMKRSIDLLPPHVERPPEDGTAKPESLFLLSEKDDQRCWGKAAALMARVIQSGNWRLGPGWGWISMRYPTGQHSPLMREASRRCLPLVESALREHPGHHQAWTLWAQLAENAGGRPLRPLMDAITPLPGAVDFVPESVLTGYIRSARSRNDWADLVEVLGPRWEQKKEETYQVISLGEDGKRVEADTLKGTWESVLQPLVEAHLRLGSTLEADRIVREIMTWMPSKGLPGWASALALRCGQPSWAAQWAALSVPKG